MREHDVTTLTAAERDRARRELFASLTLARPGSPVRALILTRISAIAADGQTQHSGRSGPRAAYA